MQFAAALSVAAAASLAVLHHRKALAARLPSSGWARHVGAACRATVRVLATFVLTCAACAAVLNQFATTGTDEPVPRWWPIVFSGFTCALTAHAVARTVSLPLGAVWGVLCFGVLAAMCFWLEGYWPAPGMAEVCAYRPIEQP